MAVRRAVFRALLPDERRARALGARVGDAAALDGRAHGVDDVVHVLGGGGAGDGPGIGLGRAGDRPGRGRGRARASTTRLGRLRRGRLRSVCSARSVALSLRLSRAFGPSSSVGFGFAVGSAGFLH